MKNIKHMQAKLNDLEHVIRSLAISAVFLVAIFVAHQLATRQLNLIEKELSNAAFDECAKASIITTTEAGEDGKTITLHELSQDFYQQCVRNKDYQLK